MPPILRVRARKVAKTILVLCLCGIVSTGWARDDQPTAQDGLGQLSLEQLGTVEVTTVSKEPEQVWDTPAAIYVLTQEDIRRSGATTIPEALRLVPGVEVARIDSDHWSVGIRGFGSGFSKSILVLIDGRSVYTPLFAGVYWDVQTVVLEDVDRIEVIRGPGGTIWGANAVNGVINIITKSAADTKGALVSVGGGDLDQATATVRYGGGIGGNFSYRAYGTMFARSAEIHPEDPGYDDWRQQRGGFRTDWSKGTSDTFTVQGDLYRGTDGEITSVGSFTPASQVVLAGGDDVAGGDIQGRWKHTFTPNQDLQVQAYWDRDDRHALQYGEDRDTFDLDILYHVNAGKRQSFLVGGGARLSPSTYFQTISGLNFTPSRQTDSIYSGFAQDEIQIVPRKLALTVGSKFESNNFSGFDAQPSLRLMWTPSSHQSVWGAVTRALRDPSRLDTEISLYDFLGRSHGLPVYLEVLGDPSFEPEQLVGYEAGYRTLVSSKLYLDFAAFDNQYDDLVSYGAGSSAVRTSPFVYLLLMEPFANGIDGAGEGFEIAPDWKPTGFWQLKGSYSFLHLNTFDRPGFTDTSTVASYNGSSPTSEVTVQSLLDLPKRFEADVTYRFVSQLPAQDVAAYSTADVRFGWHANGSLEFSVVGQNLLQPEHGEFGNTPSPVVQIRRTVYAKATWNYAKR